MNTRNMFYGEIRRGDRNIILKGERIVKGDQESSRYVQQRVIIARVGRDIDRLIAGALEMAIIGAPRIKYVIHSVRMLVCLTGWMVTSQIGIRIDILTIIVSVRVVDM